MLHGDRGSRKRKRKEKKRKEKYSPRLSLTLQPEARSGALDLSFPPFNQRIADI